MLGNSTSTRLPTAGIEELGSDGFSFPRRRVLDFRVRINDPANFAILCKDVFQNRIYQFESDNPNPRVLDCGANIGMATLFFKHVYPGARITAFEPDPQVVPILRTNLADNAVTDVNVVPAAVATSCGERLLHCDGRYASTLEGYQPSRPLSGAPPVQMTQAVSCVRLRDYLGEPVDFVKLNIEGAEHDVLLDSEDRLNRIRTLTVEYHHWPGRPRLLHPMLALLDRSGFDYVIHSFDRKTNPQAHPPFRLGPGSCYYLLVHAVRRAP